MDPKIFMFIVAIALIHTCTHIQKFFLSFAPIVPLLLTLTLLLQVGSFIQVCRRDKLISVQGFCVKASQISVSLKVRKCENYTLYYVPLEVIRWNKCDVHTVVFVVGKLQRKLKCRGRVSSITRVFTILIGK